MNILEMNVQDLSKIFKSISVMSNRAEIHKIQWVGEEEMLLILHGWLKAI